MREPLHCVKLNTLACRGIPETNIVSEDAMSGRRQNDVCLLPVWYGSKSAFFEISQCRQVHDQIATK